MQHPDEATAAPEPIPGEPEVGEALSPLDPTVEAPINAAVQDPDIDEKQGTEGG